MCLDVHVYLDKNSRTLLTDKIVRHLEILVAVVVVVPLVWVLLAMEHLQIQVPMPTVVVSKMEVLQRHTFCTIVHWIERSNWTTSICKG